MTSFHTTFYASRPLPNTYASVMVNVAAHFFITGRTRAAIATAAACAAIFRCDMLIFVIALAVVAIRVETATPHALVGASLSIVATAAIAVAAAGLVSVGVDSLWWGRIVWPEAVVLLFNTASNRSGEWGRVHALWYFTNAIPKSLPAALLPLAAAAAPRFLSRQSLRVALAINATPAAAAAKSRGKGAVAQSSALPSAIVSRLCRAMYQLLYAIVDGGWGPQLPSRVRPMVAVYFLFVAVYSILPHKEIRFILPLAPFALVPASYIMAAWVHTPVVVRAAQTSASSATVPTDPARASGKATAAGAAAARTGRSSGCSVGPRMCTFVGLVCVATGLAYVAVAAAASWQNYPGGVALERVATVVDAARTTTPPPPKVPMGSDRSKKGPLTPLQRARGTGAEWFVWMDTDTSMTGGSRFGKAIHAVPGTAANGGWVHYTKDKLLWPHTAATVGAHDVFTSEYNTSTSAAAEADRDGIDIVVTGSDPALWNQYGFRVAPWIGIVHAFKRFSVHGVKDVVSALTGKNTQVSAGGTADASGSAIGIETAPSQRVLIRPRVIGLTSWGDDQTDEDIDTELRDAIKEALNDRRRRRKAAMAEADAAADAKRTTAAKPKK